MHLRAAEESRQSERYCGRSCLPCLYECQVTHLKPFEPSRGILRMLQSPPNKKSKLSQVTASTAVEHSYRRTRRSRIVRRSHSAPASREREAESRAAAGDDDRAAAQDDAVGFSDGDEDAQFSWEREFILPQAHPSQQEHRSESSDQNSLAWDTVRDCIFSSYVSELLPNTELVNNRKLSIQNSVQRAVSSAATSCPSCPTLQQNLTELKKVEILWVGSQYRFSVLVPVHLCHNCGSTFGIKPLQAGCFPSTPLHSWEITQARHGQRPLWFDLSMLKVKSGTATWHSVACFMLYLPRGET